MGMNTSKNTPQTSCRVHWISIRNAEAFGIGLFLVLEVVASELLLELLNMTSIVNKSSFTSKERVRTRPNIDLELRHRSPNGHHDLAVVVDLAGWVVFWVRVILHGNSFGRPGFHPEGPNDRLRPHPSQYPLSLISPRNYDTIFQSKEIFVTENQPKSPKVPENAKQFSWGAAACFLPIGLMFIGGAVGGALGGVAVAVNLALYTSNLPRWKFWILNLLVGLTAIVLWLVIGILINLMMG